MVLGLNSCHNCANGVLLVGEHDRSPFADQLPETAKKLFSEGEIKALKEFLCNHPGAGDIIPGTGGLRKLRWASSGRGKRGGARVIYYYDRPTWHVLLLTGYAKNRKEDLTEGEKKVFSAQVDAILRQEWRLWHVRWASRP